MEYNLDEKLKNVMSIVFELKKEKFNNDSSPDNIEGWDSLKHMILIGAIEDEFKVQFSDEEMLELLNYKLIKLVLKEKLYKS